MRRFTWSVVVFVGTVSSASVAFAQTPLNRPTVPESVVNPQAPTPVDGTGTAPSAPPIGLWRELGNDFRHLPSRQTGLILGVAGSASLLVAAEDGEISTTVSSSTGFDHLFEPGDGVGNGAVHYGAAFGAYAIGRMLHKPAVTTLGDRLIRAQIIDTALIQSIKFTVGRTRPDGGSYSFPSGHTSSSFATATVIQQLYGWKFGVPAYALASFVGGSRVQERRHFLSDVVFGAAIGVVAGRTVTIGHGRATFALSPIASPGRAGIGFAWTNPNQRR